VPLVPMLYRYRILVGSHGSVTGTLEGIDPRSPSQLRAAWLACMAAGSARARAFDHEAVLANMRNHAVAKKVEGEFSEDDSLAISDVAAPPPDVPVDAEILWLGGDEHGRGAACVLSNYILAIGRGRVTSEVYHFAPAVRDLGLGYLSDGSMLALCGARAEWYYTALPDWWKMADRVVSCPGCVAGTWEGVMLFVAAARRLFA
jgi:hypothetical protein